MSYFKSYLLAISKVWATECSRFNITSNCISPAFMLTKLTAYTDERIIEQIIQSHPLRKILTSNEVADAVVFLINASQQINATNIIINAVSDII